MASPDVEKREKHKKATVPVRVPVYFSQKSKQVEVQKGEQAHLQCTAIGDRPIEITWMFQWQRINDNYDKRNRIREEYLNDRMVSVLRIARISRYDTGMLSCHAWNAYGEDEMFIQLIVQEVPETPINIRVSDQQSRSLQLSWTPPFAGNSPITSYIVQYKLVSDVWVSQPTKVSVEGGQTTAVVSSLSPASSYHFRILAENFLGLSEPSEVIQVTTQEEVPTGAPLGVRVEAISSTEFLVTWDPPPREHWNSDLLEYHVGYRPEPPYSSSSSSASSPPPSYMPHTDDYIFKTVEASGPSGVGYGDSSSGASSGGVGIDRLAFLQGLEKNTTYAVVVQAFNSGGTGPASQPVVARTMDNDNEIDEDDKNMQESEVELVDSTIEPKVTMALRTTLPNLLSYTNYSLSVLAFTSSDDEVQSPMLDC